MSSKKLWLILPALVASLLLLVSWIGGKSTSSAGVAADAPEQLSPARRELVRLAERRPLPGAAIEGLERVDPDEERPPYAVGLSNDELAEITAEELKAQALGDRLEQRGEEVRRQELGRQRFQRGVEDGGLSASQMDEAVIELFDGLQLEPILDAEGMLEGLTLEDLDVDNPLRVAGFRRGDVITRIGAQELRDPAEIPSLLVGLSHEIDFCGYRENSEFCGTVNLD